MRTSQIQGNMSRSGLPGTISVSGAFGRTMATSLAYPFATQLNIGLARNSGNRASSRSKRCPAAESFLALWVVEASLRAMWGVVRVVSKRRSQRSRDVWTACVQHVPTRMGQNLQGLWRSSVNSDVVTNFTSIKLACSPENCLMELANGMAKWT